MRHEGPKWRVAFRTRVLLTLLLVFMVTTAVATWELYPLISTHSRNGEVVSAELVWIEVRRWIAVMITSLVASSGSIALLSFGASTGPAIRRWIWVLVIVLLWTLPSLGTHWPERDSLAQGWLLDLPWLYTFWPLVSVVPIVMVVHRLARE